MSENQSSTVIHENSTLIPADTSMHASLTLSKVNVYQHSEWNSVITKLTEMKMTPEDALRILSKSLNHTNSEQVTVQEQQNRDLSNQSDNMRKTIIAEFTATVDLMDVPDEIDLKPKIKFEIVNNYNSGKVVKLEYETTLRSSVENMIQMSDHKQSTNKPENDKSKEGGFPNLNDPDTIFTQNLVVENLKDHLNSQFISTDNVYNILLLGETGVGKSTFINAFANYMKYSDFETAKENKLVQLIQSKFTIPDPETSDSILINSGMKNENERTEIDRTSSLKTQMSYTFQYRDRTLRIIDTPSIDDTNDVNVNRTKFYKIFAHLHHYNKLHGILVLIKASETRKTAIFKYYITEMLTHLHRSASKNLIFCFTFSRSSFFSAGEGFATLESFFENELKDVHLILKPNVNCFFIDNEAYRFLVAQKQGYKFIADETSYKESWKKSVEQCNKMWERVIQNAPHILEKKILQNNVRKLILELAKPMIQLQANIQSNISHLETEKDLLKDKSKNIEELGKQLYIFVDELIAEPLDYPSIVCTSSKCTEVTKDNGKDRINYKTRCHENFSLKYFATNAIGNELLKNSPIFKGTNCAKCGCGFNVHMHITMQYIKVKRPIIDTPKQQPNIKEKDRAKVLEDAIKRMEAMIKDYKNEFKVISDICTKIEVLFTTNSSIPNNKIIEPYFDLLMEEELKMANSVPGYSRSKYETLKQIKDTHLESVQKLENAINGHQHVLIQPKDILQYKDMLFGLKQTGAQFRQCIEAGSFTNKKNIQEKVIDLRNVPQ